MQTLNVRRCILCKWDAKPNKQQYFCSVRISRLLLLWCLIYWSWIIRYPGRSGRIPNTCWNPVSSPAAHPIHPYLLLFQASRFSFFLFWRPSNQKWVGVQTPYETVFCFEFDVLFNGSKQLSDAANCHFDCSCSVMYIPWARHWHLHFAANR